MAKTKLSRAQSRIWEQLRGSKDCGLSTARQQYIVRDIFLKQYGLRPLMTRLNGELIPFEDEHLVRMDQEGDFTCQVFYSVHEVAERFGSPAANWLDWSRLRIVSPEFTKTDFRGPRNARYEDFAPDDIVLSNSVENLSEEEHRALIEAYYMPRVVVPQVSKDRLKTDGHPYRGQLRLISVHMTVFYLMAQKSAWQEPKFVAQVNGRLSSYLGLRALHMIVEDTTIDELGIEQNLVLMPRLKPEPVKDYMESAVDAIAGILDHLVDPVPPPEPVLVNTEEGDVKSRIDELKAELLRLEKLQKVQDYENRRKEALKGTITHGRLAEGLAEFDSVSITYPNGNVRVYEAIVLENREAATST